MCTCNFPKEIPFSCLTQLASEIKSGAPKGKMLQTVAQIAGQAGALLTPEQALVGDHFETDSELQALAAEINNTVPAPGATTSIASDLIISKLKPLLLQLLIKLLS